MKEFKTLAIIPARGGSKRIPRKNIKLFFDKPIIQYSIEAALKSKCFDEVMVSTDDPKIANVSKKAGATVPFLRNKKTSGDKASLFNVWDEVLLEYKNRGIIFDYFCNIMATAPMINPKNLSLGLNLIKRQNADQVLTIVKYSFPIQRAFEIKHGKLNMLWSKNMHARSQDLIPTYHDTGQFSWFLTKSFLKQEKSFLKNILPLELEESEVQDIDTIEDWKVAELKYKMFINHMKD